jgi:hypothetical protein
MGFLKETMLFRFTQRIFMYFVILVNIIFLYFLIRVQIGRQQEGQARPMSPRLKNKDYFRRWKDLVEV